MSQIIAKHTLIGFRRYNFNGQKGLNLHCIENYEEGDEDSKGSNPVNISAPYDESSKLMDIEISQEKPVICEMEGRLVNRQNRSVFVCSKINGVTPVNGSGPKSAIPK